MSNQVIKKQVVQGCAAMRMTWDANPAFRDPNLPSFEYDDWDDTIDQVYQQLREAKANKDAADDADMYDPASARRRQMKPDHDVNVQRIVCAELCTWLCNYVEALWAQSLD